MKARYLTRKQKRAREAQLRKIMAQKFEPPADRPKWRTPTNEPAQRLFKDECMKATNEEV
jgi:hypothetical protein